MENETMDKIEREAKIQTLMNDPAYLNPRLPNHRLVQSQVLELRGIDPRILNSSLTIQQGENALKRQAEMVAAGELDADTQLTYEDVEGFTHNQQMAHSETVRLMREADAGNAGKEGSSV